MVGVYSGRVTRKCLEGGYVLGLRWISGVSHIDVYGGGGIFWEGGVDYGSVAYSGEEEGRFWEGRKSEGGRGRFWEHRI